MISGPQIRALIGKYDVGTQKNRLNETVLHPKHMFKLMDKKIFTFLR